MSEYLGDLLADAAQRSRDVFHDALSQVTPEQANWRPTPNANSIAWLAWHTAREQDLQIAALAGTPEVWTSQGWVDRFNLDLPRNSMGYGHTPACTSPTCPCCSDTWTRPPRRPSPTFAASPPMCSTMSLIRTGPHTSPVVCGWSASLMTPPSTPGKPPTFRECWDSHKTAPACSKTGKQGL